MSPRSEVVADDLGFAEGPVWCDDGTLVVVSVDRGCVYRLEPGSGRRDLLARTGGGPNGAALCDDGSILVTQNGGFDFSRVGIPSEEPPPVPVPAGLQRVGPDGEVSSVLDHTVSAPNDLTAQPDGTVLFTDPPSTMPPPPTLEGRLWSLSAAGGLELVADGFWLCNGIALDGEGTIIIVERKGLMRVGRDGTRSWLVEDLGSGGGDGFCLDADGRIYAASTREHGVRVVEDGREVDFLAVPGTGLTTNCCFGGTDSRTLFATDGLPGQVVAWEGMPAPGMPLHRAAVEGLSGAVGT